MKQDTQFKAKENVISTEMEGEMVLMNVTKGDYFSFNEVGSHIWKTLGTETITFGALCQSVMDEYEIDRETCEADVSKLLDEMCKAQIVENLS